MKSPFAELVDSPDIVGIDSPHGGPLLNPAAADPAEFITIDEISAALACGVLQLPYLQLVHQSRKLADEELVSVHRTSSGRRLASVDGDAVTRALVDGSTLKLNQVDHWHRRTERQVALLSKRYPVEVRPFVFLTPAEEHGLLPHRDASHVLVVQLEGRKEWTLWNPGPQTRSSYGLDVDLKDPLGQFTLEPGDVMYLPHGYPHSARAVGALSLHLTFTMALPTPLSLVGALLDATDTPEAAGSRLPRSGSRAELLDTATWTMLRTAAAFPADAWFDQALARQRADVGLRTQWEAVIQ